MKKKCIMGWRTTFLYFSLDQVHSDIKEKKAESMEFSIGVEFQSHSSFGQVLRVFGFESLT